jgi:brefeldin A-inhibited guanine nucleotide-exchange protein
MAETLPDAATDPHRTSAAASQADNNNNNNMTNGETDGGSSPPFEADKDSLSSETEWKTIKVEEETETQEPHARDEQRVAGTDSSEDAAETPKQENATDSESSQSGDIREESLGDGQVEAGADDSRDSRRESQETPPIQTIPHEAVQVPRIRSDSRSTTATQTTHRSTAPLSSTVFVVTALDVIGASKEARRSKELEDAVKQALANIKQSERQPLDPEVIFRPLQLATRTFSIPLQVTALDCIGKLITYSYFAFPSNRPSTVQENEPASEQQIPLIERAIETICDCFENEATPNEIQQQIIKSLLAAVLNDKIVVHGAGLLKAVRQIYNIFIYSKSSQNQQIAQGSLTQMVGTVFDRVRMRLALKEARMRELESQNDTSTDAITIDTADGPHGTEPEGSAEAAATAISDQPVAKEPTEKLTLQSFESSKDDTMLNDNAPTTVTRLKPANQALAGSTDDREDTDGSADEEVDEVYVKDAFLVFRALCKLSHKVLTHDQQQDIRSQNMRSKLLSLHLIHYLLNNHIAVFTSPLATIKNGSNSPDSMTLLHTIRPHLCLSLSRNGSSSIPKVFEVCCEIFWLMLKHMRVMLKVSNLLHLSDPSVCLTIPSERTRGLP